MTNLEYKKLMDDWTLIVNSLGIKLSNGNDIPVLFWKAFLGISRTVHVEIMNDTYKRKEFSPNLAQTIRFAKRLSEEDFIDEVNIAIPIYEANKRK